MNQDLSPFDKLKADVTMFVQPTKNIVVSSAIGNAEAQEVVRTLKMYEKKIKLTMDELIAPHKAFIEQVKMYAKEISLPLEEAETFIKDRQVEWAEEQKKIQQAEMKRLAEIRAAEQKAADEERIRQAEADRIIEESRLKELKAQQEKESKAAEAKYKKDQEALKAFGMDDETIKNKAIEERQARQKKFEDEQEQARQRSEQIRLENEARIDRERKERELELKKQEAVLLASKPKNTREIPEWRIVDPGLIPNEYRIIDEVSLGKAIRGGLRVVPGVEIRMKTISAGN